MVVNFVQTGQQKAKILTYIHTHYSFEDMVRAYRKEETRTGSLYVDTRTKICWTECYRNHYVFYELKHIKVYTLGVS